MALSEYLESAGINCQHVHRGTWICGEYVDLFVFARSRFEPGTRNTMGGTGAYRDLPNAVGEAEATALLEQSAEALAEVARLRQEKRSLEPTDDGDNWAFYESREAVTLVQRRIRAALDALGMDRHCQDYPSRWGKFRVRWHTI